MRYLVLHDSNFFTQGRVLSAANLRRKRTVIRNTCSENITGCKEKQFYIWSDLYTQCERWIFIFWLCFLSILIKDNLEIEQER